MKTWITCLLATFSLFAAAENIPLATAFNTESLTLLTATTNQTGAGFDIARTLYHTVHIVNGTVRTNTVYIDRSIDGTNWKPWFTNTFTTTGTVAEASCVGKWVYMRGRLDTLTGTNCNVTFTYFGGR